MKTTNDKVIVAKEKVKGNRLDKFDCDIGTKTQYIETVKKVKTDTGYKLDRSNMLISSYVYDKTHKELVMYDNVIESDITRFEVKILPRMFKRIVHMHDIKNIADKYTINVYNTKYGCNVDKVLLNAKKPVLADSRKKKQYKLNLRGVEDFLLRVEKYITLDMTEQNNNAEFNIEDFL